MNASRRSFLAAILATPLTFALPHAHAGGGGFAGAMETTQLMNNAELVAIYATEIEQVAQQLQMYINMVQNTMNLPIQVWSSVENELGALVNAVSAVNGVVNATENALAQIEHQFGNGGLLDAYEARLRNWTHGLNRQVGTALQNMGMNANQFQSRQQALAQIQAASQSATGRMQVLQAGNQIAGLMVNEMQSLHGTILSAEQARLNAILVQENREYQDREGLKNWLKAPKSTGW
jgi:P-type conjugative transfer protein TrbJ